MPNNKTPMSELRLSVTIEAEDKDDMIYWLELLTSKLRDGDCHPGISSRITAGGVLDWKITEIIDTP